MKSRYQVLHLLPVVMLACNLLPAPAQAQFSQEAKLVGTGVIGRIAEQGYSVSLSGDGNTAIVGGPEDNAAAFFEAVGAAWVYTRSAGVWTQQAKLVGTGALGFPQQGWSVSLSADGNTAIVGGYSDNSQEGAAWVYTRSGGVWSQQAKLVGTDALGFPAQGWSVSLSADGNTAIVGGPADNIGVGAAWVYTRSGTAWSQQAKLVGTGALGPFLGSQFVGQGRSVSLSGDGNTAIVSAPVDNAGVGAAWVYTRSAGVWNQQAKLIGASGPVSLSGDGNTAIVADGPAWVYTRSGVEWSQQAKLVDQSFQSSSVSLSGDGNTAIVGGFDGNNGAAGTWAYTRSGGVWTQQLKFAEQDFSVSLSGDASTAIVGDLGDNGFVGAAWVYAQPVFAGTPGKANCHGQSVSALAQQYGGLNGAAAALGYADVSALQNAIMAFCGG